MAGEAREALGWRCLRTVFLQKAWGDELEACKLSGLSTGAGLDPPHHSQIHPAAHQWQWPKGGDGLRRGWRGPGWEMCWEQGEETLKLEAPREIGETWRDRWERMTGYRAASGSRVH